MAAVLIWAHDATLAESLLEELAEPGRSVRVLDSDAELAATGASSGSLLVAQAGPRLAAQQAFVRGPFILVDPARSSPSGRPMRHGSLPTMPPTRRRPDASVLPTVVPTIQALLDQGEATRGFTVNVRGGHFILGRVDEIGPDQRFRLTPLGAGQFGLSLYDRNRWEPLPYQGTLDELVDVMNSDLARWAADWSLPPA